MVARSGWEGDIDIGSTGLRAAELIHKTRARVEGPPILVERNVEGIWIMVKDILTAIAMVDICIDNSYLLNSILMTEVSYHDSFCINGTKASNAVNHLHCVVPWRAHQGKSSFNLSLHNRFCCSNSAARGDPMSICYPR